MAIKHQTIPAGTLFTFTTGEYSDYSVHGVFRARETIDVAGARRSFQEQHASKGDRPQFRIDVPQLFLAWLFRTGKIEPLLSMELHVDEGLFEDDETAIEAYSFDTDVSLPKMDGAPEKAPTS